MDIYEIKNLTREQLSRNVRVTADITARWDGKEYDLRNGVVVKYGVFASWRESHKGVEFTVSEVEDPTIDSREIKNPLEENDRGESFAGLKGRRPKEK